MENHVGALVSGATVGGGGQTGSPNRALSNWATVSGGIDNRADGVVATVSGGEHNAATAWRSTVGGGSTNQATATGTTISGGEQNQATATHATIGGGLHNLNQGPGSTIGGGNSNEITSFDATIGGGFNNTVQNRWAAIGGGIHNRAYGDAATIAGGNNNEVTGWDATIGGGAGNVVSGPGAVIAGGHSNEASGFDAAIPGGSSNLAGGDYSFAAGRRAHTSTPGTFVWADSTDADFWAGGSNQFVVRAAGGVGLGTGNPTEQLDVNGDTRIRGQTLYLGTSSPPAQIVTGYGYHAKDLELIATDQQRYYADSDATNADGVDPMFQWFMNGATTAAADELMRLDENGDLWVANGYKTFPIDLAENFAASEPLA
ncbi:MAG: hypothetical protein R3246_14705, partial [Acidimicrobiia bacterium]|nr:hypothetical protein [Acidimicrobiia bacterium]